MPPPSSPTPLISVIVAVHDVAAHVGQAIASLKAQTLTDFEALVIDDGSTDGSGDLAAASFGGDARFRLIRQENAGLSAARNRGLDAARGAFVAFLDGDDAFAPRFLADLHAAIRRDGTDWAACGLLLTYPDGREVAHGAMHGSGDPGPARVLPMEDARAVARLFPSAWNKLYRRAFLGDLRFPEGLWFEDHALFWALATRGRALSYDPAPLYRHRRGRPGQITDADSPRVFDQFAILERLHPLIAGSRLRHADEGFARLATRVIHERARVIRQRGRRRAFLAQARDLLARHGCAFDPGDDPEVSRGLALALAGVRPLSVVVLAGAADTGVLEALDRQEMGDFDLTVIAPDTIDLPPDLPCGEPLRRIAPEGLTWAGLAARLRGRHVVIVNADEHLLPDGLMRLVTLIEDSGAPLGFAGFERAGRGYHDGWCDNRVGGGPRAGAFALGAAQALALYPRLGNRIMRRDLLARIDTPVAGDPVAVQALVLGSALLAGRVGIAPQPVMRAADRPAGLPAAAVLPRLVRAMPVAGAGALPAGWRTLLFLRLEGMRIDAVGGRRRWLAALWRLRRAGLPRLAAATGPDPETPRWVVRLARRIGCPDGGNSASP